MATTHTPGPWQVNHADKTQVCDADGVTRGCSPVAVCLVGKMAERRANARLIAAAPALLAALLDLVAADDSDRADTSRERMYMLGSPRDKKWTAARAAIAAARVA